MMMMMMMKVIMMMVDRFVKAVLLMMSIDERYRSCRPRTGGSQLSPADPTQTTTHHDHHNHHPDHHLDHHPDHHQYQEPASSTAERAPTFELSLPSPGLTPVLADEVEAVHVAVLSEGAPDGPHLLLIHVAHLPDRARPSSHGPAPQGAIIIVASS
jgi:hypothetical protein